jgi:hypothetical protein
MSRKTYMRIHRGAVCKSIKRKNTNGDDMTSVSMSLQSNILKRGASPQVQQQEGGNCETRDQPREQSQNADNVQGLLMFLIEVLVLFCNYYLGLFSKRMALLQIHNSHSIQ